MGLTPQQIAQLSPSARKQIAEATGKKEPKKSKYSNKKVDFLGITFDSLKEKNRYIKLFFYSTQNIISDLRLQVPYKLEIDGHKIETYIADFVYVQDGITIVEDCKGFKTPTYRRKKKWMKNVFGIDIKET